MPVRIPFPFQERRRMKRTDYAQIERFMLDCMKDSAHDREHVYRVLYGALEIAKTEPDANLDVLVAACLLHDIGRKEQFETPALDHALVGGEKACRFLISQGYDEAFAAHVRGCIETHRFRKSRPPESIEAKILFDADKLDATGAVGIARTMMYSGATGRPIYTRLADGCISDGALSDEPSFFHEYRFKLAKLYDRFYTAEGARLAQERRAIAMAYYDALLREVRDPDTHGKALLENMLTPDE